MPTNIPPYQKFRFSNQTLPPLFSPIIYLGTIQAQYLAGMVGGIEVCLKIAVKGLVVCLESKVS